MYAGNALGFDHAAWNHSPDGATRSRLFRPDRAWWFVPAFQTQGVALVVIHISEWHAASRASGVGV
jgi:hypothetical protein